jgi:predicted permease
MDVEARRRLGNPERVEEETRTIRVISWLASILRDLHDALRLIGNAPVLALAVIGSLAIGIGANTAIFSLIDAAILKKLPVEDPDSLVAVEWVTDGFPQGVDSLEGNTRELDEGRMAGSSFAASFYRQLAETDVGFDALIGMTEPAYHTVAVEGRPAGTSLLQFVSGNFFREIGIAPSPGRGFVDEETGPGAVPAVVVSHRFWTGPLGQDPDMLGREVRVDGVPARVVGVAPRGFFGFQPGNWTDVYAPLDAREALEANVNAIPLNDAFWWVSLFGRLDPAIPEDTARQRLESALQGFGAQLAPGAAPGAAADALPRVTITPAPRGFDGALEAGEVEALWVLQLLVGLLLLIVCANVANLLLSRSVSVQRDSSLRLALGASRGRLVQKSLIESATLALFGGIVGLGLGYVLALTIHDIFRTGRDAGLRFDLVIDWRMVALVVGLSLITTLLFGLAPAARAMRAGVNDMLKTQARSVGGAGMRLPRFLVSMQLALCLAALTSAGLLARSLDNFAALDLGIDTPNISYATVNPSIAGYAPARLGPYIDTVRDRLQALPGVDAVSVMNRRILDGAFSISLVRLPESPPGPLDIFDPSDAAHVVGAGAGAFDTLGISLLRGRNLDSGDNDSAVVDERFVEQFLGGGQVLGRRFSIRQGTELTVVGVSRNVPWGRIRERDFPVIYTSAGSGNLAAFGGRIHFAIHSSMDPADLAVAVRAAIGEIDPAVPMTEFMAQETLIDRLLRVERLLAFVSGSFGVWALILAAMGLAGLLTYAAARRTGEIGVRMALGASPGHVIGMMLRDSFSMVAIGMLIGIPCAWGIGNILESMLFELAPTDVRSFALALGVLALVALAATWLPAKRAAGIDPMNALREQ